MAKAQGVEIEMDIRRETALRGWHLGGEAGRLGVPAFRILSDHTPRTLATNHPLTIQELLAVPGIGSSIVAEFGKDICRVLRDNAD